MHDAVHQKRSYCGDVVYASYSILYTNERSLTMKLSLTIIFSIGILVLSTAVIFLFFDVMPWHPLLSANPEPRVIPIKILQNQWVFEPNIIEIQKGEQIILAIFNEDEYAHGLYIQEYGINEVLPPKAETQIALLGRTSGSFTFYCSVICGEGHARMQGKIIVQE